MGDGSVEFQDGQFFQQKVLPETVGSDADVDDSVLSPETAAALAKRPEWNALECRNLPNLPEVNIFFTGSRENSQPMIDRILKRMGQLQSLLGYGRESLEPLRIYIDPEGTKYKKGAEAFYYRPDPVFNKLTGQYEKPTRILRIAAPKGLGRDHELSHWVSQGIFPEELEPLSNLLMEGFAAWLSWQVKTDQEKTAFANTSENYLMKVDQLTKFRPAKWVVEKLSGTPAINKDNLNLDSEFQGDEAESFGAVLFDVLYDNCQKDTRKLGAVWRTAGNFETVSAWIEHCGFAKTEIETEWKNRLFGKPKAP